MSHDFRTPLASIVGASSAIASGELKPEESRELAQSIYEESLRLSRFVANLLEIDPARIGHRGAEPGELQPIEEVIGPALERVKPRLGTREIRVDLPDSLPMVAIDAGLMEQLFVNLLENVARHTPMARPSTSAPRPRTASSAWPWKTGAPRPRRGPENRVFEKFFRAFDRVEGAGLGLAICHAIVTAYGGTISAREQARGRRHLHRQSPGRGVVREPRRASSSQVRRRSIVSPINPLVLIVEDEARHPPVPARHLEPRLPRDGDRARTGRACGTPRRTAPTSSSLTSVYPTRTGWISEDSRMELRPRGGPRRGIRRRPR